MEKYTMNECEQDQKSSPDATNTDVEVLVGQMDQIDISDETKQTALELFDGASERSTEIELKPMTIINTAERWGDDISGAIKAIELTQDIFGSEIPLDGELDIDDAESIDGLVVQMRSLGIEGAEISDLCRVFGINATTNSGLKAILDLTDKLYDIEPAKLSEIKGIIANHDVEDEYDGSEQMKTDILLPSEVDQQDIYKLDSFDDTPEIDDNVTRVVDEIDGLFTQFGLVGLDLQVAADYFNIQIDHEEDLTKLLAELQQVTQVQVEDLRHAGDLDVRERRPVDYKSTVADLLAFINELENPANQEEQSDQDSTADIVKDKSGEEFEI